MAKEHRYCQYRECGICIDDMRPEALYCNPIHKAAEHRLRKLDPPGTTYPVGKPYEAVRRQRRRPTRKGSGTRIYLVPDEVKAAAKDLSPTSPESERVKAKLLKAKKKLAAA